MALNEWDPLIRKDTKAFARKEFTNTYPNSYKHLQESTSTETKFMGSDINQDKISKNKSVSGKADDKKVSCRHLLLFLVILLMTLSMGINTYVIPEYIQHTIQETEFQNQTNKANFSACSVNTSDPDYKRHQYVQEKTAQWQIYFSLSENIPGLFAVIVLGSYSDRVGRKLLFTLSIAAMSAKVLIAALVMYYNLSFLYFLIAYFVEGIFGHFQTFFLASLVFVADITEVGPKRTFYLAALEATLFVSISVSSFATGYFIEWKGFVIPMLTATGLGILSLVIAVIFLPETYDRSKYDENPTFLSMMRKPFSFFLDRYAGSFRLGYFLLFLCFVFIELSSSSRMSLETVYQLGQPFCWNPSLIGIFGTVRHAAQGIIGMGSIKLFQRCMSDEVIALIGIVSNASSYVLEGIATTDLQLFMVPVLGTFAYITLPLVRGILSKMTPSDRQGALFASLGCLQVIFNMVASVSANGIYSATLAIYNGFAFLVLGGYAVFGLFGMLLFMYTKARRNKTMNASTVTVKC